MTKRELRKQISERDAKIAKLHQRLVHHEKLLRKCEEVIRTNERLRKVVEKLRGKRRFLKARLEQTTTQLEMVAESNQMLRSELFANIQAADLRAAKSGRSVAQIELEMPGGGRPVVVAEETEKPKRFGVKG